MRLTRVTMLLLGCAMLGGCQCSFNVGGNESQSGGLSGQARANGSTAAARTQRFVNSRERAINDHLQQSYVDFAFDYPTGWTISPQRRDGTESNFVRVAVAQRGFDAYTFHVGTANVPAGMPAERLEAQLRGLAEDFGASMRDYRITRVGADRLGRYDTTSWYFTATAGTPESPVQAYGRGDIIVPPGQERGVLTITLTTDRTDDIRSPEDIARSETTRTVFDSLRVGPAGDQ